MWVAIYPLTGDSLFTLFRCSQSTGNSHCTLKSLLPVNWLERFKRIFTEHYQLIGNSGFNMKWLLPVDWL